MTPAGHTSTPTAGVPSVAGAPPGPRLRRHLHRRHCRRRPPISTVVVVVVAAVAVAAVAAVVAVAAVAAVTAAVVVVVVVVVEVVAAVQTTEQNIQKGESEMIWD